MGAMRQALVRRRALCLAFTILAVPWLATGQTVVDAGTAEFVPSADHQAVVSGQPVVTSYQMQIFAAGTAQLVRTVELGKPVPHVDGVIRISFLDRLATPLPGGVQYQARVAAVGPGGSTASALSNTFSYSVPCTPAVSPAGTTIAAAGGSVSASVTAASGCGWTATSGAAWLTVTAGATGSGSGSVTFAAAANTSTFARTATMTVAGRPFSVTQAGASCSQTITPVSHAAAAAEGTLPVTVATGSGCTWTATSGVAWLSVGAGGTGNGSVNVQIAPNTSTSQRTGAVIVAGRTLSITQAGTPCTFTVSPQAIAAPAPGTTGTLAVTTSPGCAWTVAVPTWISVSRTTGSGAGTLTYTVAAVADGSRSATMTVAGRTVTVSQEAELRPPANLRIVVK